MLSHGPEVQIAGYRAERLLWRNQGEAVYAAVRLDDGLSVTAKVYERGVYEQAPGRFEYEYRALSELSGAGLTPAVTMLELGERRAWIFPRPSGPTLLEGLATPLDLTRWLDIASQATAALAALHARRLTHRHLRPRALSVEPESGRVVLADLGFSLAQDRAARDLEQPDVVAGSLPYVSPEQTGRIARSVDYRSDLYSLGAVLFQLALGRPPFAGQDVTALIHAHLAQRPPVLAEHRRDLPRVVSDIVARLLAKDPGERYQSADGLLSDLRRFARGAAGGDVSAFELGSDDRPDTPELPERLYGRDEELTALRRALAEARQGQVSVWVVSGAPGIGKTALIDTIGVELAAADGHYAAGKFDLARRAPFSAFTRALAALGDVLLARPEHERARWRARIADGLGGLGAALLELAPALHALIGDQPRLPEVGSLEAKHRSELAMVRFFRAVASADEPLLLFIDDVQWSDPGSIEVWERLALDEACRGLVLVSSYRAHELPSEHPFHASLERIEARGRSVSRVALGAISAEAAVRLMMDGLHIERDRARLLSALLSRRTEHNPLVIRRLLQLLADRGVLVREGPRWTWDEQRVLDVGLPASLIDVIQTKIDGLAERERAALAAASCLGSRFDTESLAAALDCAPVVAFGLLAALREQGLLVEADGHYHFEHDGVLEAATARLHPDERYDYHVRAGWFRRGRAQGDALDAQVFTIVGHLNRSIERERRPERLLDLAGLNLRAASKAVRAAAYAAALDYVESGLSALSQRAAERGDGHGGDVLLSSGLRLERARAVAFAGDYAGAGAVFDALLAEPLPALRLAEICVARVEVCLAAGQFEDALRWGLVGLAHTGLVLPRHPSKGTLGRELLHAAWLTRGDLGRRIRELPECAEPHMHVRIELLSTLVIAVIRLGGEIVPLLFLAGARDTFRHGLTPAAPHVLTTFGTLLVGVFGQLTAAAKVADEALALARASNARHRAKVLLSSQSMLLPWTRPFERCLPELSKVYGIALLEGDAVLAGYGLVFVANCHMAMGVALDRLRGSAERARSYLARTATPDVVAGQEVLLGIVEALAGPRARSIEADDPFDVLANGDTSVRCASVVYTSALHCIAGHPDRALRLLESIEGVAELTLLAVAERGEYFFWRALAAAMNADPRAWKRDPKRRAFEQGLRQYRRWAKLCPENFASKALLLEAERVRLVRSAERAAPLYARAAELGQRHGRLHIAALAHERSARTALGSRDAAERAARRAVAAYRAWGAAHQAARLEAEFQIPLAEAHPPVAPHVARPPAALVDVATVLETTRAITSAPDYPSVVERLMAGLIENVGAERGVLVLEGPDGWVLEAGYGARGLEPRAAGVPLDAAHELVPVGMLRLVEKKRTPLIYDDAQREPSLARDAYVVAARVRAAMCIPIELSTRCIGLIYLENNLSPGIFTPERVEMVVALAAQAAISLTNARLVAALRASEAEWRSLVDHAPDWITIVNREHVIEFSNHAPEGSNGRAWVGARMESFMAAAGRESLSEAIEQVFERGGHVSVDTSLTSDGRERSLVTRVSPIAIDGKVSRVTLLSTDVTERRALEEHLSQTQKLEAIGTLASGVAHDFNNLLGVIVSSCEVGLRACDDGAPADAHRRAYDTILATSTRANSLTRQLLTFGRKGSSELEYLSLNQVVEHSCKMLERLLGEDVRIERALAPRLGSVHMNRGQLEQVLLNLCVNARDAMPDGGTLTLRTLDVELAPERTLAGLAPGRYAQLSVTDTGSGMDEATQRRIFEPFFTTKEIGRGTGLGLATVHGIVHRARGHVRVTSGVGLGSTFDVFLPAVERAPVRAPEARVSASGLPRGTETILLVEDNHDVRSLTAAMLEGQGYRVIAEASGDAALRNIAALEAADLLFTDVLLPGLKGPDLAREVLRRRPSIKVLYSSGGGLDFEREPTAPGHPQPPLLAKPYTLMQLARTVRSLLDAERLGAGRSGVEPVHLE